MARTFVIAEAASAHDRDFGKAKRLIDAAALAGADAVKFQFWSNATHLAHRRNAQSYLSAYLRYALPVQWLPRLRAHAESRGLEFMCTAFLPEDIAVVAPFVKRFKVSSFEAFDTAFLNAHAPFDKPMIISVGMAGDPPFSFMTSTHGDAEYLHCVSAYPTPISELNLAVIHRSKFDPFRRVDHRWYAGLSDHTGCIETGGIAVAAGALILEVHMKLEDTDPANPDAGEFALLPESLTAYVTFVRQVETMLGDGVKRQMPSEAAMAKYRVRA